VSHEDADALAFDCPRCRQATETRFYGPCPACRQELRASLARTAQEREEVEYVPKLNVTPNAVATKD
jgi:hypothetical protein